MWDNPMVWVLIGIVAVMAFVMLVSFLATMTVAFFGRRFSQRTMTRYRDEMTARLPQTDCGQCGFSACCDYADAVLRGEADETLCPCGGEDLPTELMACRQRLLALMEDPTPPRRQKWYLFGKRRK